MEYSPVRTNGTLNSPRSLVRVLRVSFVARCTMVILALGMMAPVESAATPTMVPLATWAGACMAAIVMSRAMVNTRDELDKANLLASGQLTTFLFLDP